MLRKRTLRRLESLESRCMLAGNVNVFTRGNDVYIRETTGDLNNDITITQDAAGVTFTSADGTTFNGAAGPLVIAAADVAQFLRDDVFINLKGGDNRLTINGLALPDELEIDTGDGADVINITGAGGVNMRDLDIDTRRGNDQVDIQNVNVSREISIDTDRGNDVIGVRGSSTGRDLEIEGGRDNDQILVQNTNVGRHLQIEGNAGDDDVLVQGAAAPLTPLPPGVPAAGGSSTVGRSATITTDGGEDRVRVENYTINDDLDIRTGKDDDCVLVQNVLVRDDADIRTDGGDDTVVANNVRVDDDASISLGSGNDNALAAGTTSVGDKFSLSGGSGDDAATSEAGVVAGRFKRPSSIESDAAVTAACFAQPGGVGTPFFLNQRSGAAGDDLNSVTVAGDALDPVGANGLDDEIDRLIVALFG